MFVVQQNFKRAKDGLHKVGEVFSEAGVGKEELAALVKDGFIADDKTINAAQLSDLEKKIVAAKAELEHLEKKAQALKIENKKA